MRFSITTAAAAMTAAALLAPAAPAAAKSDETETAKPPKKMSSLGGRQLGKAGTQVRLNNGAPGLPDDLTGRSWIVADAESGEVLAAHNPHWRLPPASTLKMLFADTLLPRFDKHLEHKVDRQDLMGMGEGSSLVGIKEENTYTVHDMWLGVFLRSGNDAVHVLSAMNGGVDKTVADMQQHARDLQARDTHVISPDGYDEPGQLSSAYDLTLFARSGMQNADFREYCSTLSAEFPGEQAEKGKKRETYAIQNTNRLLGRYEGLAGVKNGYTSHAGTTFTGVAQRGDRTLLVTVMHPKQGGHRVYDEASELLDWGFDAAGKVQPVGMLVPPKSVAQPNAKASGQADDGKGDEQGKAAGPPPNGARTAADTKDDAGGAWTALGVSGGVLLLLGGVAFVVHRRWPVRRL